MATALHHPPYPVRSRLVAASPVYYGWVVLAAATLSLGLSLPGNTAGIALFIDSFIADLGVSRGAVSLAYTLATVLGALTLPWAGRALDRFGPRAGGVVIAALFSLACLAMSAVQGLLTLFAGFFLLRALGQGGMSLVSLYAVNLWFSRRRGLAVGLMGGGIALTTAFGPPLIEAGIASLGWRTTYAVAGLGLLAVLVPTVGLLLRHRPEAYGLAPAELASDGPGGQAERSYTLAEARRSGIFWLLVAGIGTTAAIGTGLIFHHIAVMGANGLGRGTAALLFVPYGLVTAFSNVGAGVLVDRFAPRRVLAVHLALFAAMVATVPLVHSAAGVWAYGLAFGFVQGLQNTLAGSAFAYYFGRAHLGAIKGFVNTVFVVGTAMGPLALALGEFVPGGYAATLWALALLPLGLAALALRRSLDLPPA